MFSYSQSSLRRLGPIVLAGLILLFSRLLTLPLMFAEEVWEPPQQSADSPSGVSNLSAAADSESTHVPLSANRLDEALEDPGTDPWILPASMLQPAPVVSPRLSLVPRTALPSVAAEFRARRLKQLLGGRRTVARPRLTPTQGITLRAIRRPDTDAASTLRNTPATGVLTQRRSPVIHDPRVRGSRIGQLAASGSFWVPARIDLETPLSSIDADIVQHLSITKGPYNVRRGPALNSVAFELADSPRFETPELHGLSRLAYQSNGEQWSGRQSFSGGGPQGGFEVGYGHRTGSDYRIASGTRIPSSYNSRVWNAAAGYDIDESTTVELHALRLDQSNVEIAGQAFDINSLMTTAVDARLLQTDVGFADGMTVETWFNTTDVDGDASRAGKRRIFPLYDQINFRGATQVQSLSTGARIECIWEPDPDETWIAGIDLRHVRQELDEQVTFTRTRPSMADSPIPRSATTGPGIYLEQNRVIDSQWTVASGIRADVISAEVLESSDQLQNLGTRPLGVSGGSLADVLGRDEFDQTFIPWAAFVEAEYDIDDTWSILVAGGHAERPPSLTELYAAQPFMFLLQNGLNTVRGDPRLEMERAWQIDLAVGLETENAIARLRGFHAWVNDYITFENIGVQTTGGQIDQVNLQYVNTELATLAGFEFEAELKLSPFATGIATISFVDGRDRTRNGNKATSASAARFAGLPRGAFGGIVAGDEEPLPGILPLESRLGLRFHDREESQWWVELAARVVGAQNRVATSLFETQSDGFTVWNLTGGCRLNKTFSVVAGVENFTDKLYREHLDFRFANGSIVRQPGINIYLGSEARF